MKQARSPRTQKNSKVDMASTVDYKDPDVLRELYHGAGLSLNEIVERCELNTAESLRYWLKKFDIERRTPTEARRVEYANYRTGERGYEHWMEWDGGENSKVYVHRLAAVSHYGFDAVANMEVHHKNKIRWDNRPENIELMKTSDHRRHHMPDTLLS